METILYADILFLINFAMDFISLAASASLGAKEKNPLRLSIAAALGSVYAIAATVSGLGNIPQLILAAIVGATMCLISFGFGSMTSFIRQCIIFWGCGALLGGIMTAILSFGRISHPTATMPVIAISSIVVLFFIIRALRQRAGCKSLRIKVCLNQRSTTFEALCDSGNLLRDPFSGAPVIVASHKVLSPLLGEDAVSSMLECSTDALCGYSIKIRLIPHGNVNGGGMMCAFVPDSVTITAGNRTSKTSCLIAPSPHHDTYFAGFAATAPSVLIP